MRSMTAPKTPSVSRLKVCRIVTVPQTFQTLLKEQLRCTVAQNIDLTLLCGLGPVGTVQQSAK